MSTDADAPTGREREGPEGLLIDARGLKVQYAKGLLALDDLSLRLEPGVHGLLGANGAGKSTLIKVLLGLLQPTAGEAFVLGLSLSADPRLIRQRVGYMPERDAHVPMMTAIDYVTLFGEISGLDSRTAMKRAHEVLHYVELGEARYRSVEGFSAGMRQRLKLAAAIVHDPDLLFLDEPTNGLDPDGRRDMLDLVRELGRSGISVVLSTHLLPDVQEVCSSVVFVHRGRVRQTGAVKELTHGLKNLYVVSFQGEAAPFLAALHDRNIRADYDETSGRLRLKTPEGAGTKPILEAAVLAGVGIERLSPGTRSLEEVFFSSIDQKEHSYADS